MRRRNLRREKKTKLCAVATLILPILLIATGSTVFAEFMMTARLTAFTNAESGDIAVEISGWKIQSTNTFDANGNGITLGDELRIDSVTDGDGKTIVLGIIVDPIFPDWYLNLTVGVHNTLESTPVTLIRRIYALGSETNIAGLLSLFRIKYSDEWYDETGQLIPDITTYEIWPCHTITTLESLTFDGQNYPELQDQTFSFMVEIQAIYPQVGG